MNPMGNKCLCFLIVLLVSQCSGQEHKSIITSKILTGAEQMNEYMPLLKGKVIAIVANQTSVVGKIHLVDTLQKLSVKIKTVFAPEHGFRGEAEAGEHVKNNLDVKTGIPVVSLYGDHKKPSAEELKGIDIVVFDIQDVGVRFYTYISTLQYLMEACAENNVSVLVLDRPNPNGFYVDGPLLDKKFASFVGMNPIPVVHGLTIAEYALMLNGERWLANEKKCELFYIKCKGWDHATAYELPIPPSPNLPNMAAVYLYPSLCFFEGTMVSVGRGTDFPFQVIGYPEFKNGSFEFTPKSITGKSAKPLYENKKCKGFDLRDFGNKYMSTAGQLYIYWLLAMYESADDKEKFFNTFFEKLAGNDLFRQQIVKGMTEEQIRASWQADLLSYKLMRKKYLLYKDFE